MIVRLGKQNEEIYFLIFPTIIVTMLVCVCVLVCLYLFICSLWRSIAHAYMLRQRSLFHPPSLEISMKVCR